MNRFLLPAVESIAAARQLLPRSFLKPLFAMALLFALLPSSVPLRAQTPQDKASLLKNYGRIPLHFEPNVGQANEEARFISRGNGYAFFLTPSEAVLVLRQNGVAQRQSAHSKVDEPLRSASDAAEDNVPQAVLHSILLGANPNPSISASQELPGKSNYFVGNDPEKWHTDIPSFGNVKYEQVYPGVDLVYHGNQSLLEYDFIVAAGANPKWIRLAISGEEVSSQAGASSSTPIRLKVDKNGDLVVSIAKSEVRYQKPVAYQTGSDGQKQLVAARFVLKSKNEVGFALSSYDRSRTLVIDPTVLYSTYIAGATNGPYYFGYYGDQAAAVAVDSSGSAYVTGSTASGDFPLTAGAYQKTCKPYSNGCAGVPWGAPGYGTAVFVSKLSPDGSALIYSTYIAGSVTDNATSIALDSSGNAYIAGFTNSPDFPVTQGAYQTTCGPELVELTGFCTASSIVSECGAQGTPDGFVTKLNSTGSGLVYSTFLGGSLNDYLTGIAVNSAGEAYVSGFTLSSYSYGPLYSGCAANTATASYGYPITPGGYFPGALPTPPAGQPWPFGNPSAFTEPANSAVNYPFGSNHTPVFSKLSADGSTLLYSTYIGGGFGPAFPSPGSQTLGDGQTFYPYLQQHATGIAVDSSGNAYLTGWSNASDKCCTQFNSYQFSGFPTTPGVVQPQNGSDCVGGTCAFDGFVAKFDPTQPGAASLVYSTNLGGQGDDYANAIAVDSSANAYVIGTAGPGGHGGPPTFPTTQGTIQPNCPGSCNNTYGWVTKLNSTATALNYSTYLSGSGGNNSPTAVALDSAGNAYVAGQTNINDGFPQQNALQGFPAGTGNIAYISVLDPTASTLLFSTFLGGSYGNQGAGGIALDSSDNIYVTGSTTSSAFPTTTGAFQTACAKCSSGSWGVFVTEISAPAPGVAPTITSVSATTFQAGSAGSFTVMASGSPAPSLSESGALPAGVTFTDNGNGTGTLSGTATSGGTFSLTFTAHNSVNPDATQNFTLTVRALQSIAVTPASASVMKGATQAFTATGTYSDNTTADLTSSVTWSSSDTTIATIAATGVATGVKAGGPVTITATQGNVSNTAQLTVTAPALQSISVTPASASVAAGLTQQFNATGHYSDSTTADLTSSVTWSSSDTTTATIAATGVATGVKTGGPVTITATQSSISGTAQLTVTAAALQSITVSPTTASVAAGLTQQFTATGHYSDNSTQALTTSVTWTSSNTAIATISNSAGSQGLAKGVAAGGPVTITATQNSISGTAQLTVTAAALQSITVSPTTASVAAGLSQQFTATGHYSDNSTQTLTMSATWSSSNTSVATISNAAGSQGLAKGVAAGGPVTITATQNSISGTAQLTVTAAVLASIAITPTNPSVPAGSTQQFTATGTYSDGSMQNITSGVTWASSNTAVATISASGLASALAAGSTTISATQGNISNSTTMTVVPDFAIAVTPASQTVKVGRAANYTLTLSSLGGLTGTVSLSCSGAPAGSKCSETPASVTLTAGGSANSMVTVKTGKTTPLGTYTLTFTGVDGPLHHSVTVTLVVSK